MRYTQINSTNANGGQNMDSLMFALLILVPGTTVLRIVHMKVPGSRKSTTQIEEIAKLSIYGMITFFITTLSMRLYGLSFVNLNVFLTKLNNFDFLFKYILLTALVTYFVGKLLSARFYTENKLMLKNKLRKINNECEESEFITAWDEIFENYKNKSYEGIVIEIFKGGTLITQGEVSFYNPPDAGIQQIKLVNTETIKNYFAFDSKCENDIDKFFGSSIYELYDFEKDILIKFYNPEKYIKYCDGVTSLEVVAD